MKLLIFGVIGLLLMAGVFVVASLQEDLSEEPEAIVPEKSCSGSCGNSCSTGNSCGKATCSATTGGRCGCS